MQMFTKLTMQQITNIQPLLAAVNVLSNDSLSSAMSAGGGQKIVFWQKTVFFEQRPKQVKFWNFASKCCTS